VLTNRLSRQPIFAWCQVLHSLSRASTIIWQETTGEFLAGLWSQLPVRQQTTSWSHPGLSGLSPDWATIWPLCCQVCHPDKAQLTWNMIDIYCINGQGYLELYNKKILGIFGLLSDLCSQLQVRQRTTSLSHPGISGVSTEWASVWPLCCQVCHPDRCCSHETLLACLA